MVLLTKGIAKHGINCEEGSFYFLHFRGSFVKVICNASKQILDTARFFCTNIHRINDS